MAKDLTVHFEGRDMPMSDWLELIRLRHEAAHTCNEPAPPVIRQEDGRWVMRDLYDPALDEAATEQESEQH